MRNCDKYLMQMYCMVKKCCKNSRKYLTTKFEEEEMAVKMWIIIYTFLTLNYWYF